MCKVSKWGKLGIYQKEWMLRDLVIFYKLMFLDLIFSSLDRCGKNSCPYKMINLRVWHCLQLHTGLITPTLLPSLTKPHYERPTPPRCSHKSPPRFHDFCFCFVLVLPDLTKAVVDMGVKVSTSLYTCEGGSIPGDNDFLSSSHWPGQSD